jgi:N-acetylglucosaminyl-diphospho-decaprenol L-rhamnosyltransferase
MVALQDVSVVVVTYQSAETIERCLESVVDAGVGKIVVVDNASGDDTVALVRPRLRPIDVLIPNPDNRGFGAAINQASAQCTTAWILVLNPDATIARQDLERLVATGNSSAGVAVIGPQLVDASGQPITSAGRLPTAASVLRVVVPGRLARVLPDHRLPPTFTGGRVGYVEGACFLVRSRALANVGGFDERFFMFFEEQDLARRLGAEGWSIELDSASRAVHLGQRSRAAIPLRGRDLLWQSALRYQRRWHGTLAAVLLRALGHLAVTAERTRGKLDRDAARRLRRALAG